MSITFVNCLKLADFAFILYKMGKNRRFLLAVSRFKSYKRSHSGDDSTEDPPVPIPNTEVKLCHARSSWVLTLQDTVVAGFQKKDVHFVGVFFYTVIC